MVASEIFTSIEVASLIKDYYESFKNYFGVKITNISKRLKGHYFQYDMDNLGDLYFWRDFLKEEFYNPTDKNLEEKQKPIRFGDVIELDNSNISRWVPFFPAKRYSIEGKQILNNHKKQFPDKHDFGLEEELVSINDTYVLSGFSTIRLSPSQNHYLLSASADWCSDGIPCIIDSVLYEKKLQEIISNEGCVRARLIGTLSELPFEWKNRFDRKITITENVYGLPRCVIKVNDIKKIGTSKRLYTQAWTQFVNSNKSFVAFNHHIFSPKREDNELKKAVELTANYKNFLESDLIGGTWNIDFEFDETRNWFSAKKYKNYNADAIGLFNLYYGLNPMERIYGDIESFLKKSKEMIDYEKMKAKAIVKSHKQNIIKDKYMDRY